MVLAARTEQLLNNQATLRERQALARDMTKDIHHLLDARFNKFFATKSALMMYYDADWVPEHIPDSMVNVQSVLYMLRLTQTALETHPVTNERRLKETELVERARAQGVSDAEIFAVASTGVQVRNEDEKNEALLRSMPVIKSPRMAQDTTRTA